MVQILVTRAAKLSLTYRDGLEETVRARHGQNLRHIGGYDPHKVGQRLLFKLFTYVKLLPKAAYQDIVNYLVFSPSPYTREDLKIYKSLKSYNQFLSGWVQETYTVIINNKHVVTAKVRPRHRTWTSTRSISMGLAYYSSIVAVSCNLNQYRIPLTFEPNVRPWLTLLIVINLDWNIIALAALVLYAITYHK